jgi:hypothetical protein
MRPRHACTPTFYPSGPIRQLGSAGQPLARATPQAVSALCTVVFTVHRHASGLPSSCSWKVCHRFESVRLALIPLTILKSTAQIKTRRNRCSSTSHCCLSEWSSRQDANLDVNLQSRHSAVRAYASIGYVWSCSNCILHATMFFNSLPTVISSCCSKCGSKNFSIPIAAEKMYESPKTNMWSCEKPRHSSQEQSQRDILITSNT